MYAVMAKNSKQYDSPSIIDINVKKLQGGRVD